MTKATLVVLHGWGLSKKKFEPLVSEFKKRAYSVVALDFPGFGEEPAPKIPWTITDYAKFLRSSLERKGIDNPIIIGHSFGGRVALRYSSLYPNNVRALILSGTPGYTPIPRKKMVVFIAIAKVGKLFFSLPVLSLFLEKVRRWYYYLVGAKEFNRAEGPMKETFKKVVKESLEEDMKNLLIPSQLLWGSDDMIVPVHIAERMKTVIQHSRLVVIADADHGVPYKQPTIFAQEVETFLKSL